MIIIVDLHRENEKKIDEEEDEKIKAIIGYYFIW